jgi:hypothetical protein
MTTRARAHLHAAEDAVIVPPQRAERGNFHRDPHATRSTLREARASGKWNRARLAERCGPRIRCYDVATRQDEPASHRTRALLSWLYEQEWLGSNV